MKPKETKPVIQKTSHFDLLFKYAFSIPRFAKELLNQNFNPSTKDYAIISLSVCTKKVRANCFSQNETALCPKFKQKVVFEPLTQTFGLCYSGGMETLATLFSSLDKKIPIAWILLIIMIFMFIEIRGMAKDIDHINKTLTNHITDTNKKIDRISDRIDKQNDQFNRLYELLLREKQNKSSK